MVTAGNERSQSPARDKSLAPPFFRSSVLIDVKYDPGNAGTGVAVGVDVGSTVGVAVGFGVSEGFMVGGIVVSVEITLVVAGEQEAEITITRRAMRIDFVFIFFFFPLICKILPNPSCGLHWGGDGEAVQPEK